MKILIRIGIVFFGLLSIFAFTVSLLQIQKLFVKSTETMENTPQYHFSLYLPNNRYSFYDQIIEGAEQAAEEIGAAISIHTIDTAREDLDIAVYTGVDGFIVCPYVDDETAKNQLGKLSSTGIPLVLINHNVPNDTPWPYIGTNNFDVGRKMGIITNKMDVDRFHLAIVYSEKSPGIFAERELVEMGITTSLGDRLVSPVMSLKTNLNPLDAEEKIYQLFRSSQRINTVIFTNENDTLAATQVLVDLNLVGQVQIIGFGNSPGILEYMEKGIIAGSIVTNPITTGYQAVYSLEELCRTGYTSSSVDTGVAILGGEE